MRYIHAEDVGDATHDPLLSARAPASPFDRAAEDRVAGEEPAVDPLARRGEHTHRGKLRLLRPGDG